MTAIQEAIKCGKAYCSNPFNCKVPDCVIGEKVRDPRLMSKDCKNNGGCVLEQGRTSCLRGDCDRAELVGNLRIKAKQDHNIPSQGTLKPLNGLNNGGIDTEAQKLVRRVM